MTGWVVIHAASTWFLAGLIWTIQVVHYPLFASVGDDRFAGYHADHTRRIGWLVVPLMPLEAAAAIALAIRPPAGIAPGVLWVGVGLVAIVWGSTAALQVPQHRRLARGFDRRAHDVLVRGNAIRTAAWTARAVLATALVFLA